MDSTRLLPELVDLVLSFIASPQRTHNGVPLKQYTLVSKDWLHPGRRYLFRRKTLWVDISGREFKRFIDFLNRNSHLRSYIRDLLITPDTEGRVSVGEVAIILQLLPQLQVLELLMLGLSSESSTLPQDVRSAFSLEQLHLSDVYALAPSPTSSPFHDLLSLFSSIRTLVPSCCQFNIDDSRFAVDRRVAAQKIHYLADEGATQTGIGNDEVLLIFFRDIVDPSSIETFAAYLINASDLSFITQFIEKTYKSAEKPITIHYTFKATARGEYAVYLHLIKSSLQTKSQSGYRVR